MAPGFRAWPSIRSQSSKVIEGPDPSGPVGPAGCQHFGRPARGFERDRVAPLPGDQGIRVIGQEVEVGGDDRGFQRPSLVDRGPERRQDAVEDVGEREGVLAGDEVAIGGKPHRLDGD